MAEYVSVQRLGKQGKFMSIAFYTQWSFKCFTEKKHKKFHMKSKNNKQKK